MKTSGSGPRFHLPNGWLLKALGVALLAGLIFFIGWFGVAGLSRSIENSAARTQSGLPLLPTISPSITPAARMSPTPAPSRTPIPSDSPTPPLVFTPTNAQPPRTSCGRPAGWVTYIIQSGDTLSRLSAAYNVTVAQLQNANCMGTSTILRTGQAFYVPYWGGNPVIPTLEPTWPLVTEIPTEPPTPEFVTPIPTEEPTPTFQP